MESGRLDLESAAAEAEVNGTKESVATYKSIPDDDSNWQANNKADANKTTMGNQNEDVGLDDGAQEKMLNDESNIVAAKEPTEVKFISENGDAKIDIETVAKTLSGMGKEELMKYANDPFWIRLRWFLFIGFWLIWVGMLAGAIAIIVMAPRCAAPEPKKWWEESPILQLDADDIEGRDAKSIDNLLDDLQGQHVKVLSLSNFVGANGHTTDFRDVQPKVGGIANFDTIVKAAKKRGQRVVLELDPNHSSLDHPWFERSVKRDDKYTNYYVWADNKTDASGKPGPPNNWLSINGGSAWEWNEARGQNYLHQFNKSQPDFNFRNPAVVAEFSDILSHWLERGVSGFRLGDTQYLIEDPSLSDEKPSVTGANDEQYSSLSHVRTKDYVENGDVLRQWRELVMNRTKHDALFTLRDNIGADMLALYNSEKRKLIDLPQSSMFLETANASITAKALHQGISQSLNNTSDGWPTWNLNGKEASLRERMPADVAESLTLMTLLLPGTPIVKLNETLSAKEAFAPIAKGRSLPPFQYGKTQMEVVNGTVFVYTRLKSGNPGYLVAYQSSDELAYIDVSELNAMPDEVNVLAHSSNYLPKDGAPVQKKLSSAHLRMPPKSTLVVTFVPKDK